MFNGSLEYFIGDGVHKYSELTKYAAAEASTSKKANTLVLRNGSGKMDKASLPDDLTDLVNIPDANPTTKGIVKASTTKAADNAVKSDANGSLDGWKDAISDAVANPSAGLVKNSDGTLGVDFDQMPTDKFEALLKSLKMQIPLEANLDLYVNKDHSQAGNTIVDGRGTQNKPFASIQSCVNFVTQTYALGSHDVNIYVVAASTPYTENLRLPEYTHTSGAITIRAFDDSDPPTLTNNGNALTAIAASGGAWYLRRLNISCAFASPQDGSAHYPGVIQSSGGATSVSISGCALSAVYSGEAQSSGNFDIRFLQPDGGSTIAIVPFQGYKTSLSCTKGNASHAYMIYAVRGSRFTISRRSYTDDGITFDIPCSGTVNVFCYATGNSQCDYGGSGNTPQFSGTVTGKRYEALNGSSIVCASDNGFPGDTEGTAESSTFSWYKGPALS